MKSLLACLFVLFAVPSFAQTTTVAVVTDVDIIVIAATGDPLDQVATPAIASRRTPIAAGSALCNQAFLAAPIGTLVNPTVGQVPDPFIAGRFCRLPTPIGLLNATALRLVARYNSAAGMSGRSPAGILPFDISGILVPPAAPISVDARP